MRVYALRSSQVPDETLDVFLSREAAEAELREILRDEPSWVDVLRVEPDRARRACHLRELNKAEGLELERLPRRARRLGV
jgi:hypothetical protein